MHRPSRGNACWLCLARLTSPSAPRAAADGSPATLGAMRVAFGQQVGPPRAAPGARRALAAPVPGPPCCLAAPAGAGLQEACRASPKEGWTPARFPAPVQRGRGRAQACRMRHEPGAPAGDVAHAPLSTPSRAKASCAQAAPPAARRDRSQLPRLGVPSTAPPTCPPLHPPRSRLAAALPPRAARRVRL